MGGKPSKGTPADRRLAVNKTTAPSKPAAKMPTVKPAARKGRKS